MFVTWHTFRDQLISFPRPFFQSPWKVLFSCATPKKHGRCFFPVLKKLRNQNPQKQESSEDPIYQPPCHPTGKQTWTFSEELDEEFDILLGSGLQKFLAALKQEAPWVQVNGGIVDDNWPSDMYRGLRWWYFPTKSDLFWAFGMYFGLKESQKKHIESYYQRNFW